MHNSDIIKKPQIILQFLTYFTVSSFDLVLTLLLPFNDMFIRGKCVTQRSMGREASRYPPQYQFIKRSNLQDEITCHW